jgi:hypothetical protein
MVDPSNAPGDAVTARRVRILTVAGVLAFSLYPIFAHEYMSISDLYNHLARASVLLRFGDVPRLREFYEPAWELQPNLALDVFAQIFGAFLPIGFVAKLFIAAIFLLMLGGALLLHRAAFGRWSAWAPAAAMLLYNRQLIAGGVNFLFSVGVYLCGFALWLFIRERPAWQRIAILAPVAFAAFASHLFGFGLLGLSVAAYEISDHVSRRTPLRRALPSLAVAAAPFLLTLVAFAAFTPVSEGSFVIEYRSLFTRLRAFGIPVLYDPLRTLLPAALVGAVCVAALATRALRVHRGLLVTAAVLFAAQLAMPNTIMTATSADHRLPVAFFIVAICAVDIVPGSRLRAAMAAVILVAALLRMTEVNSRWAADQAVYAEVDAAFGKVPEGSLVASACPRSAFDRSVGDAFAVYYLPTFKTALLDGFMQNIFAIATQHPLVMRSPWAELAAASPPDAIWASFVGDGPPAELPALRRYDYVVFTHNERFRLRGSALLEPVHEGEFVKLCRVVR